MKILLVEDDCRIARPLAEDLRHQSHAVDVASDGVEGWNFAEAATYDLILLDVMLPRLDGLSLCKRLRSAGCSALILMLTARDTIADKVVGLDAGADDYLVKPFALEELSARIRALSRRSNEVKPAILTYGQLEFDPAACCASYAGQPLLLTNRELMILECFLRVPNQVLTRATLLSKLWELGDTAGEGTVKTHLTNLRHKLRTAGAPEDTIETVYGIGYRLGKIAS